MKRHLAPPGLHLRRSAPQIAVLVLLALVTAPDANAQCVQDDARVVRCFGTDPDGFIEDPMQEESLRIEVKPFAGVQNGGEGIAIVTNDGGSVEVEERGRVSASGNGGIGISGGRETIITNLGVIGARGPNGIGVAVGPLGSLINSGRIFTLETNGIAVFLQDGSEFRNLADGGLFGGTIAILGDSGANTVVNLGEINGGVDLGGGDDSFYALGFEHRNSQVNGPIDGGAGVDRLILGEGVSLGTLDLDTVTNFESLRVVDSGWTFSGSAVFADGTIVESGSLSFDRSARLDGAVDGSLDDKLDDDLDGSLALIGGSLGVYADVTFVQGLTIAGGRAKFSPGTMGAPGADVTGAVKVTSGAIRIQGAARFRDGVTVSSDGFFVFTGAAAAQADIFALGGTLVLEEDAALLGNLTLARPARFESGIASDGSTYQLDVTGTISITDSLLVIPGLDPDLGHIEKTYTVLTATSGIVGEFGSLEFPGLPGGFQGVSLVYGPAAAPSSVQVIAGTSYIAPARSANQLAVGTYLDAANQQSAGTEFQKFLDSLTLLDTLGATSALDALHAEIYDVHTSAAFATAGAFADLLATRPIDCIGSVSPDRRNRPSREACSPNGSTVWVNSFGRFARRDGGSAFRDWTYGGGGVAVGLDRRIDDTFLVSGMLGASRLAMDFDGDGDGSATSFDFGLALAWQREATHVRGVFEYGHTWHETRREVEYPGYSQLNVSDHQSDRFTLLVEGGHEFLFGAIEIEPLASVEYTCLHEDSTKESRNLPSALVIDSRKNVLITSEVGVRVGATLTKDGGAGPLLEWADGVWRPEFRGGWRQVLNDYDRASSARFREAPDGMPKFRSKSEDAQYGAELGLGLSFQPQGKSSTVHVGYEAFVGNRTLVHSLMASLRIPF